MTNNLRDKLRRVVREGNTLVRVHHGVTVDYDWIYLVDDKTIAKKYKKRRYDKNGQNCRDVAYDEYEMGRFLLENGVQVPEMYGVERPDGFLSQILRRSHIIGDVELTD